MYSKDQIDAVKATALPLELTAANGRGVFVCPACGRPRVYNPTAAGIWFCQRCKQKGDVFTLVRLRDGVTHERAFADMMNKYCHGQAVHGPVTQAKGTVTTAAGRENIQTIDASTWRAECKRYLREAAAALPGSNGEAYMAGRGFTLDTLQRFGVGYDARARVHGALKYGRPAVVYPYSSRLDYYGARFLTPIKAADGDETKAMKPPAAQAGNEPLFNVGALYGYDAVIVVEGPFDAMAVTQGAAVIGSYVGAVALCGTSCGQIIERLTKKPTSARLLIALDNDEAGRAGAVALAAKLDTIGQRYELMDSEACFAGCKDAGELLQLDAAIMGDAVGFMLNEPAARL